MSETVSGLVYYASKDAQNKRLYKEGMRIKTSRYYSCKEIEPNFIEVNFDSSGTNYIHLDTTPPEVISPREFNHAGVFGNDNDWN